MKRPMNNSGDQNTAQAIHEIDPRKNELHVAMKRVQTFKDLLEEEQRLAIKLKHDKEVVTAGMQQVKAKIQPASAALGYMNSIFCVREKPGIVAHGVDMVIDLVTKKYLFKRSGWLLTLVGSYAVRRLSQFFLNKKRQGAGTELHKSQ